MQCAFCNDLHKWSVEVRTSSRNLIYIFFIIICKTRTHVLTFSTQAYLWFHEYFTIFYCTYIFYPNYTCIFKFFSRYWHLPQSHSRSRNPLRHVCPLPGRHAEPRRDSWVLFVRAHTYIYPYLCPRRMWYELVTNKTHKTTIQTQTYWRYCGLVYTTTFSTSSNGTPIMIRFICVCAELCWVNVRSVYFLIDANTHTNMSQHIRTKTSLISLHSTASEDNKSRRVASRTYGTQTLSRCVCRPVVVFVTRHSARHYHTYTHAHSHMKHSHFLLGILICLSSRYVAFVVWICVRWCVFFFVMFGRERDAHAPYSKHCRRISTPRHTYIHTDPDEISHW